VSEGKKKLLFVFHNSGLTGASLVLLRYVQFLKHARDYELFFLLPGNGKMAESLGLLGKVGFYNAPPGTDNLVVRGFRKFGIELKKSKTNADRIDDCIRVTKPDLVYFNTIACAPYISAIQNRLSVPVAWHIHELELGVKLTGAKPKEMLRKVQWVIANSQTTAEYLRRVFAVSNDVMSVHHPVLPPGVNDVKRISDRKFVVGSSGTALVHKGALLFVDLAAAVNRLVPENDFEFRWVGNTKFLQEEIETAIGRQNLKGKVLFIGETDAPLEAYSHFNFFVSLSFEESFGLACMEAASLGIPIGGFSGSGGIEELLKQCDGLLVPHLDISAMAKALIQIRYNPEKLFEMGRRAAELSANFRQEVAIPEWIQRMERVMNDINSVR